jgi:hypothetical protein
MEFPIKYLGIPLLMTKLLRSALQSLVDQVADRLPTWRGQLMHPSGQLTLIRMTLSSMLVYTSNSLGLPPWMHKALQKIKKALLWTWTNVVQGGKCLVAWSYIQLLLELGGLVVIDLHRMWMALCLLWLWLQCADQSKPWL